MMLSRPGFIFAVLVLAAGPAFATTPAQSALKPAAPEQGTPRGLTCLTQVAVPAASGPHTRIIPAVYEKQRVEIATEAGVPEWKRSDTRRLSSVFRVDPHDGSIWYLVPGPARRQVVERDVVIVPERIETIPAPAASIREVPVLCAAELTATRIKDIEAALIARGYLRGTPGGVWTAATQTAFAGFQRAQGIADVGLVTIDGLVRLGLMGDRVPGPVPAVQVARNAPVAPTARIADPAPEVAPLPTVRSQAAADDRVRRYSVQREILQPR